jgi:hypothetical protein
VVDQGLYEGGQSVRECEFDSAIRTHQGKHYHDVEVHPPENAGRAAS